MEKTIEIDINYKSHLVDRYNDDKLSSDLLKYILKEALLAEKSDKIKIILNKKTDIDKNSVEILKQGLKEEYNISLNKHISNNKKQIGLLILGIIFIFLSTQIQELVWKEIVLIVGWVPIWEMIRIELFLDVEGRRKRKIIKKLLNSEIIEKIIE